MGKRFQPLSPNLGAIRKDIESFRTFLVQHEQLHEKKDVLPFFQSHPQLCAMIAISQTIFTPDSIDFEHDLFGDFAIDLVVGSHKQRRYCFVEFEDANATSIFKGTNRSTTVWGTRVSTAFFQMIDWFWKMDTQSSTPEFNLRFGDRIPHIVPIIITGRSHSVDEKDRQRLRWLAENVLIKSSKILVYTFDDLLSFLDDCLQGLTDIAEDHV